MHDDQADQREANAVNVPRQIGDYKILRVLGVGGMSIVYAALQNQPRRMVALKVMKQGTTTSVSLRRFRREIEILGRLHHPYIAQVFDAGMHDDGSGGVPYFVMEYVAGAQTVLEHVASNSLPIRDVLKLFVKICAAVENGHYNKVVHRDLKPGNILIDRQKEPKIIDFGVARATEVDASSATMQTEAGRLVGTVQYMAPEQVDAEPQDIKPSCDVYALGVLLYKLLTTRFPHSFEGLPIYEAVRIIRMEDPPKPSSINTEVRGDLETIMMRCLEKEPARRYQSAGQLGRDVLRYLGHVPIKARPAGLWYRLGLLVRRRKSTLVLAATMCCLIVLVAVATAVIVISLQPESEEIETPSNATAETTIDPKAEVTEPTNTGGTTAEAIPTLAVAPTVEPISLQNQDQPIEFLTFMTSPNLVNFAGGHFSLWNYKAQTETGWPITTASPTLFAASGPQAQRLAVASGHHKIMIIDTKTGEVESTIRDLGGEVQGLGISRDGTLVAYSLDDYTIRVWSKDRSQRKLLRSNSGVLFHLCFNATNTMLGGLSEQQAVVWSLADEKVIFEMPAVQEPRATRFVGDLDLMVAVGGDGVLMMWDVMAGKQVARLTLMPAHLDAVTINPMGTMLLCAAGNRATVWSLPDRKRAKLEIFSEAPIALAVDDITKTLALGFADGMIVVKPWPQSSGGQD